MNLNWLDKAISFVSPSLGLQRVRARVTQQALLSYDAVRSDRRQGGWSTTGASGNAEIGPAASRLRENARDLARNNAFAKKIVRRRSKRAIGYGVTPQADTGNATLNKRIDELWKKWTRQCCSDRRLNFGAVLQMIVETEFVSGEVLIRLWDRRASDGLAVPFQVQVLEPDYLDTAKTQQLDNGYIIHGVQFDLIGRVTGYWLFGQHPGDVVQTSIRGLSSRFVPAESVLHHAQFERPGDVRAVSRFAPVTNKLRDVDEYADAEIVRKKTEACLTMFVTQPEGENGKPLGQVAVDAAGNKIETMSPGLIGYGSPGTDAKMLAPASSGDYSAHKKTELREISAGTDMPYVVVGEDLSDVNYSSFRGGAIDERDGIDQYRWNWLVPQVLDPIWERFINTLVLMGEIPEPIYEVKWNFPPFDLLDRKAEAEADELELQIGKKTWPQLVGDQGFDAEQQIQTITEWKSRLDEAGVSFAKKGVDYGQSQQQPAGG